MPEKPSDRAAPRGAPFSPLDIPDEPAEGEAERAGRQPRSVPIGRPISPEAYERLKTEPGAPDSETGCAQEDTATDAEENA